MNTPEIKTAEFAILDDAEVTKTLAGLEESTAVTIKSSYGAFLATAEEWMSKVKGIVITDATQLTEMSQAREARLALRKIRCGVEDNRKKLKADAIAYGKSVDGIANLIFAVIEPIEAEALEKEKFAERMEAERIAKLTAERTAALAEFNGVIPANLGLMAQPAFDAALADAKMLFEAKAALAAKAEAERIEAERMAAEERERIRAENQKLKAEAAAREAAMQAEREAAAEAARAEREKMLAEQRVKDEAARKEREAVEAAQRIKDAAAKAEREAIEAKARAEREKVESEAKAARLAQAKAENEAREIREAKAREVAAIEAAKVAAAKAPEKEKLMALAAAFRAIEIPELQSEAGKHTIEKIRESNAKFATWIESAAKSL